MRQWILYQVDCPNPLDATAQTTGGQMKLPEGMLTIFAIITAAIGTVAVLDKIGNAVADEDERRALERKQRGR